MRLFFLTGLATLSLASTALALQENQCPPQTWIEQARFTDGIRFMSRVVWGLFTDNFEYNGKQWNTVFITPLKEAEVTRAIAEGQQFFNTLKLSPPEIEVDGNKIFCIYAQGSTYSVLAATPPWPLMTNNYHFNNVT